MFYLRWHLRETNLLLRTDFYRFPLCCSIHQSLFRQWFYQIVFFLCRQALLSSNQQVPCCPRFFLRISLKRKFHPKYIHRQWFAEGRINHLHHPHQWFYQIEYFLYCLVLLSNNPCCPCCSVIYYRIYLKRKFHPEYTLHHWFAEEQINYQNCFLQSFYQIEYFPCCQVLLSSNLRSPCGFGFFRRRYLRKKIHREYIRHRWFVADRLEYQYHFHQWFYPIQFYLRYPILLSSNQKCPCCSRFSARKYLRENTHLQF